MKVEEMVDGVNITKELIRELVPGDNIGIHTLPEQLVKKHIHEGFVFNLLLVGETGIGKSTLACSLFNISPCTSTENHMNPEVKLKSATYNILEKSVNVALTIVETKGFGDQINRVDNVTPIIQYIENQFEMYLQGELKIKRSLASYKDTRIHACLYYICPTGHNLKSLDVFCMKQLNRKVNLIPIIAKSDCLSPNEIQNFKMSIRETLEKENIEIYHFPTDDDALEYDNSKSNDVIPFAVSASRDYVPVGNKLSRARIFPWGTLLVENEKHSDFLALRHALIETNMEDMKEKTNEVFYETYRKTRLLQLSCSSENESLTVIELVKNQRKKIESEKLEKENMLKKRYAAKVKAKDEELEAQKIAMYSKYNTLFDQMKKEQSHLDSQRRKLESEIFAFKKRHTKQLK